MTAEKTLVGRRSLVVGTVAALAGILLWPSARKASAQKATLIAGRVDRVPDDPEDALWRSADALDVPLAPQAVVKPRTYETGVKSIRARALYDKERLAFMLEWGDPKQEVTIGGVKSFRDAIAVEFPADPANRIPYFGMGELNNPVTIYQWKADWQLARQHDVDEEFPQMAVDWYPFTGQDAGQIAQAADYAKPEADKAFLTSWWAGSTLADPELQGKTPVEKLAAEGFGTINSVEKGKQDGLGKGQWKDGIWKTVISFPRAQEQFAFEPGKTVPVAFAAWDGARQERGGEKGISTWYFLGLGEPVGAIAYIGPVLVVAGAVVAQLLALRLLRRKTRPTAQGNP